MHLWHTGSVFHHKPSPASCRALDRYPRCGSTSLRLIGALSLTAAAVSGLELPAWPDRHSWSSHRCAHGSQVAEHHVRGTRSRSPQSRVWGLGFSGWLFWPDSDHGPPGCIYGIPVRSFIINRAPRVAGLWTDILGAGPRVCGLLVRYLSPPQQCPG